MNEDEGRGRCHGDGDGMIFWPDTVHNIPCRMMLLACFRMLCVVLEGVIFSDFYTVISFIALYNRCLCSVS